MRRSQPAAVRTVEADEADGKVVAAKKITHVGDASRDDLMHDRSMHISRAEDAAGLAEGLAFVVETQ